MIPILLISFFIFLALGFPIAVSLGLSSLVGLCWQPMNPIIVVQRMFVAIDSFPLMAVPLYMLAGFLMSSGGISRRLVDFSNALVGHITGGLAHVNILASMFFAGISGSAVADTAGIGNILIPSMIKQNYERPYSTAVTAISSTIGIVIPPSIPMVIIGAMLSVSVGKLFLGGILPGLIIGFCLMFTAYIIARRKGFAKASRKLSVKVVGQTFLKAFWSLLMPLLVVGGIVGGVVTPTEAGAIAVTYALLVGVFIYRELKLRDIYECLWRTGFQTAKVFFVIATAGLYTWLLTANGFPRLVGNFLLSLTDDPVIMMALIVAILLVVTTFMESLATLILLLPILFPVAQQVGIDPIYFGVMVVISIGIGLVTPPVGLCLYVAADIAEVSIPKASKALIPYIVTVMLFLVILLFLPGVITAIPRWILG